MDPHILYVGFWFLGLVGMPIATLLFSKAIPIATTQDTGFARLIIGWGMFLTAAWFVIGGWVVLIVLSH